MGKNKLIITSFTNFWDYLYNFFSKYWYIGADLSKERNKFNINP